MWSWDGANVGETGNPRSNTKYSITIAGPNGDAYPFLYMVNITPQIDHPLATTALFPYYQLSEYQFTNGAAVNTGSTGNTFTTMYCHPMAYQREFTYSSNILQPR